MTKQIPIPCPGYNIQVDWYKGDSANKILLTFVGYGSRKKSNHEFMSKIVKESGVSALVVDLSGHGESPFELDDTTPAQHLLEATKAYDWLRQEYPVADIFTMGSSYGGFIAAYLSRYRKIKKLILRTPAIYEPSMLYSQHRDIDKMIAREYRRDSEAVKSHPLFVQPALSEISTLLILHESDEVVPTETTDIYKAKFNATTYTAEGFAHSFRHPSNPTNKIDEYYNVISSWLTDQ